MSIQHDTSKQHIQTTAMPSETAIAEDWNIDGDEVPTLERLDSSAISILSASGTLVPPNARRYSISTFSPQLPHSLSRSSTTYTLATIHQQAPLPFDLQSFKSILHDLNEHLERFEALNDQILDAMTLCDEVSLGITNLMPVPSLSTNSSPHSVLRNDEYDEQRDRPKDLEGERRITAQSIADIILTSWPRLYSPATAAASIAQSPISMPTEAHIQSQSARMNKQKTKVAIQLKQNIASFWSAQSQFQERAQVVLDIFQDPTELENEERVRTLRSRHLNNLLSSPHSSTGGDQLEQKFKADQEKLLLITEKLQGVWLETVLMLETYNKSSKSRSSDGTVGETSDDGTGTPESIGRKLLRIGKSKKQAIKSFITNCFHSGAQPRGRATELRYENTHLDTIFALSTHPGKAGIAVVRVSGPQAKSVLRSMTPTTSPLPKPRYAATRRLLCPQTNELLDKGMVIWFPGPKSFTGEDSVEFHCHGGKAVIDSVLRGIGSVGPQVRLAEAGEFARRAFENDKLDLTEVEGLADLLNAETEAQRRLALRQADGGLKTLYDTWRTQLIQGMALIEALIDFGEDENIEDDVYDNVVAKVRSLYSGIKLHMDDDRRGEILRDGIHVTILGPPNAGKSSFLNLITKRQAAIVSSIPGTTRDIVEVSLDIGGYPILIGDTAGLRSSKDEIEMEGVRRAQDRINLADINIAILPVTEFMSTSESLGDNDYINSNSSNQSVDPIVLEAIRRNPKTMVLINKMDLSRSDAGDIMSKIRSQLWPEADHKHSDDPDSRKGEKGKDFSGSSERRIWAISCQTGEGVGPFLQDFIKILKDRFESSLTSSTSITQYRHRKHLENCLQSLEAFLNLGVDDVVLGAEELRHAASDLGRITGRVDVEEVLDVVFREFCIGK
ncbi:tRNA modification GTPase gtpbp3, mitochondrial [Mortierella sp. AM989]|nr:tRNA modification GTPase gtpbp3, mitochondrial [Mortierella sp. AM989]